MTSTRICQTCSGSFTPTPGAKGLYCSPPCSDKGRGKLLKTRHAPTRASNIKSYNQNPNTCAQCISPLDYNKRKNKFCSSSCAAIFNNTGRVRSAESKQDMSVKMKQINLDDPLLRLKGARSGPANSKYKHGNSIPKLRNCIVCHTQFTSKRKTCSEACRRERNRQAASDNLRKNRHKYVGPTQRSYMERTFVEWLEAHGITKGVYGYWDQVHFKHKPDGKVKNGWADFVFVSRRLIIELDGTHHKKRTHLDAVRDAHLSDRRGYKVIRITHAEYTKQTRLKEIERALGI
jgi:predicted nucleic acid-binding Zn ribbon protein